MIPSRVATLCLALAVAGCVSTPQISEDPAAIAAREKRNAALTFVDDWLLQGRAALSDGQDGGSGSVRWSQRGPATELTFSAPLGRGGFKLNAKPGTAELKLEDGEVYRGRDVDQLLRDHTGWDVPVEALSYWVRGLKAPGRGRIVQDVNGLPAEIQQFGWLVTYRGFRGEPGEIQMPRRVEAVKSPYKVKLVIRDWSLAQ